MNGVYWIYGPATPRTTEQSNRPVLAAMPLAVVLCPRGGADLQREIVHLKRAGIETLVSMLSQEQVEMLNLQQEGPLARRLGMEFVHHPIPDHELPADASAFRLLAGELARKVRAGKRVGVHCWGSIGRATLAAACTLIHMGWSPPVALAAVETARGCAVPDTEEQERWILNYRVDA